MLERLKNWLIKRLGGYTKEEYDDWSRVPISKPYFREAPVPNVIKLVAVKKFSRQEMVCPAWFSERYTAEFEKDCLVRELAGQIVPFVEFQWREDPPCLCAELRATLYVADRREKHGTEQ